MILEVESVTPFRRFAMHEPWFQLGVEPGDVIVFLKDLKALLQGREMQGTLVAEEDPRGKVAVCQAFVSSNNHLGQASLGDLDVESAIAEILLRQGRAGIEIACGNVVAGDLEKPK